MSLINRILVLPAHAWVWVLNKKIIRQSVWDRAMTWRARK